MLILLHHVLLAIGIIFYGFNLTVAILIYCYAITFTWLIGSEVTHLKFSHTEYKDTPLNKILTFFILLGGYGSPLSFASIHRLHHKHADTELDPHSPKYIGAIRVYFLFWNLKSIPHSLVKDFIRSKFQLFIHNHWIKLHFLICFVLLLIDPRLVFFGISPLVISTLHTSGLVNVLGHNNGSLRNAPELILTQPYGWRHKDHHDSYKKR